MFGLLYPMVIFDSFSISLSKGGVLDVFLGQNDCGTEM